jgi:DNA-binding NarL/FixJ family response regulator
MTAATDKERKRRGFTPAENNLILALYEKDVPPSQIAARLGISAKTILNKLRAWQVPPRFRSGVDDPAAKAYAQIDKRLPREDQFTEMLAMGFPVKRIGEVMGYKDYKSTNAAFQRLRRHMGKQAR